MAKLNRHPWALITSLIAWLVVFSLFIASALLTRPNNLPDFARFNPCAQPDIQPFFDSSWNWDCPHPALLADEIGDYPPFIAELQICRLDRCDFPAPEATADAHGQYGLVPYAFQLRAVEADTRNPVGYVANNQRLPSVGSKRCQHAFV
jgi:hypothetical protein